MRGGSCRRLMPVVITSSYAARMPWSLSVDISSRTSVRSISKLSGGGRIGRNRRSVLQLAPNTLQADRQQPVFERGAVAQRTGLLGEHRHVVPGIVDRFATAEATGMFAGDRAVLADHDAIGIGLNLDRPAYRA